MLFEKVIEMGSSLVAQPGGNFQDGQLGTGQELSGVREFDAAPIRYNRGAHVVPELFLNIGVAVGDSFDKLRDCLVEIIGILHGEHQGIQPFREIVVKLGALMQHTGAKQLNNNRFTDHQIVAGRAFTGRLDIQTGLFNFRYNGIGGLECKRSA